MQESVLVISFRKRPNIEEFVLKTLYKKIVSKLLIEQFTRSYVSFYNSPVSNISIAASVENTIYTI